MSNVYSTLLWSMINIDIYCLNNFKSYGVDIHVPALTYWRYVTVSFFDVGGFRFLTAITLSPWEIETRQHQRNWRSVNLPTPRKHSLFNDCTILIAWHTLHDMTQWNQYGGCWCPGAYLAPGHLQLSWSQAGRRITHSKISWTLVTMSLDGLAQSWYQGSCYL